MRVFAVKVSVCKFVNTSSWMKVSLGVIELQVILLRVSKMFLSLFWRWQNTTRKDSLCGRAILGDQKETENIVIYNHHHHGAKWSESPPSLSLETF